MRTAVISFTENGRRLSGMLSAHLGGSDRFCFYKHTDCGAESFTSLSELIGNIFGRYGALVFIGSVGIAVRAVAPHIRSKVTDPAVVAVDDGGKFAVPVLSGHLGGANRLSECIAGIIGAVPIITTSSDVHGLFSPDVFAKDNGLVICDMNVSKAVAAAVVNGEKVGFSCKYPHAEIPRELTENENVGIGIRISDDPDEKPFETTLNLIPKNLVVGIGCKRGTSADTISAHITEVFSENGLDIRRLANAATIDIKSDERGLTEFCERRGLALTTFTADELMNASGEFSHSDFVEKTTGADNVCERAAVCAGGTVIVPKTAANGVTAAVAELPVFIGSTSASDFYE